MNRKENKGYEESFHENIYIYIYIYKSSIKIEGIKHTNNEDSGDSNQQHQNR